MLLNKFRPKKIKGIQVLNITFLKSKNLKSYFKILEIAPQSKNYTKNRNKNKEILIIN